MRPEMKCLALLCAVGIATPLRAQDPGSYRDGFWVAIGTGPAYAQIDCSACGSRPAGDPWDGGSGWTGYAALGGTLRQNLLVGAELNSYYKGSSSSERDATLGTLTLAVQYYPDAASRVFVKAGAGLGFYSLVSHYYLDSFMGRTASGLDSFGFAAQAGVGYDVMLTKNLALVPSANIVQVLARGERDDVTGAALAPSHPRFLQVGIGFHWY
jgi:hypothetical protein